MQAFLTEHRGAALLVAPTRRAGDDLIREVARSAGWAGGIVATTLERLAAELSVEQLAEKRRVASSALGARAVAGRITHAAMVAGELEYFAPVAATPGFPRALEATLRDLRAAGVPADRMSVAGPAGRDLARLLERHTLDADRRVDASGLFDLASARIDKAAIDPRATHSTLGKPIAFLCLEPRARADSRLIERLAAQAPAVLATALVGEEGSVSLLEHALGVRASRLEEVSSESSLERVRSRVFVQGALQTFPPDPSLELFSASNEARECVELARRVRFAAKSGVRFDEVAVLLRNPTVYQPLIEDAFRRAEIATFSTRGASRPNVSGRAFLALLHTAEQNLSASRFAEYLSLGQTPELDEEGATATVDREWVPPSDAQLVFRGAERPKATEPQRSPELEPTPTLTKPPGREPSDSPTSKMTGDDGASRALSGSSLRVPRHFERLLVDAAVMKGRARWRSRLDGLANELDRQIEATADDPALSEAKRKDRARLDNLRRFALPIIELLAALPQAETWRDWLVRLDELAEKALRDPLPVKSVLADLAPLAEVGPVTLSEVRAVLSERLSFLYSEPQGRRFGRVFVSTIEESAGRSFRWVFVPGLAEGVFPRRVFEDPLLLDEARRALDAGLEDRTHRFAHERSLLRIAAASASEKLVASWPRVELREGRSRVPSFYALDLVRASEGRVPRLHDLESRAAGSAPDQRLGWPAPTNPHEAIDDTEYDLAHLVQVLSMSRDRAAGRAAYLIDRNPALGRALRARARNHKRPWTAADGLVEPSSEALQLLAKERAHVRSYSATALQGFTECPYRFFLQAILKVRPREEAVPLETLDPRTRGSVYHSVLFRLLSRLQAERAFPLQSESLASVFAVADQVLEEVAAESRDDLDPAIPAVFDQAIESMGQDLRGWLRRVAEREPDWAPIHLELAFGVDEFGRDHDPKSTRDAVEILDGAKVRGAIDLVELSVGGAVRVTDHKTGRAPSPRPRKIGGGKHLQPVLYALAAEKLLGTQVATGRLHYNTERGKFESIVIDVDEAARKSLSTLIERVNASIDRGFLPAAPDKDACTYCDYAIVCGPGVERRVMKKDRAPLQGLVQLRGLP
ncbi:MAG: exodeoxyribonuclease V subunit gamma [Deltaproteobacteria bacterium]|nr:exodeoxyribonuclease V subunit gamma [Deltaproteobacteria bacterium]